MTPLLAAAVDLLEFCEARGWRICVIGGIAVQRWGEPRVTRDVDVSLLTDFSREEAFIEALMAQYQPRIEDAAQLAIERRVLLLRATNGVALDIALAGLPARFPISTTGKRTITCRTSWSRSIPRSPTI